MTAPRICSRFDTPGLGVGVEADLVVGVGDRRLIFLAIAFGSSSSRIVPWGESADFDIFAVGSWRSMTRAPTGGMRRLGHDERVAEAVVEPDGEVAGELEVLALVVADRHLVGVVQRMSAAMSTG